MRGVTCFVLAGSLTVSAVGCGPPTDSAIATDTRFGRDVASKLRCLSSSRATKDLHVLIHRCCDLGPTRS